MRQLKINSSITSRDSIALEKYLQEIAKIDLISSEEEVELAKKTKEGDQQALEKLTKANLRFVVSVAKQYQNQGLSLEDLINEGNIGLIKAAQRFDETKGFKFISYAVWWIRQAILQAIAEHSKIIRLPLNKVGDIYKINKAIASFEQEHEREPTAAELALILDKSEYDIDKTQQSIDHHISLDRPPLERESDSDTLLDKIYDDSTSIANVLSIENDYAKKKIENYFAKMDKKQAFALKVYYGIGLDKGYPFDDIAAHLKCTKERVRQIKDKGIKKFQLLVRKDPDKRFLLGVLQR